jgi:hypothetical protein
MALGAGGPGKVDPAAEHDDGLVALRGSSLIIFHITADGRDKKIIDQVTRIYDEATAPRVMRSRDGIARFFGQCSLVPPGVAYLTQWYLHIAATPVLGNGGTRWACAGAGFK